MHKIIASIYRFFDTRPVLLKSLLALCVLLLCLSLTKLHFVEDISSFLPHNKQNERINDAYQHIGAANNIMVYVSPLSKSADESTLTDAVEDFVQNLQTVDHQKHIKDILYNIDPQKIISLMSFVADNMPYYMTEADYAHVDSMLVDTQIVKQLERDKQILSSPAGGFTKVLMTYDPLFFSGKALERLNNMKIDGDYETRDGYLFNKSGTEAMISVTSRYPVSETSSNALLIKEINQAMDSTMAHFKGQVKLDCIGAAVISVTNAQQIKKDSVVSIAIAVVLILSLLYYFFRDFRALLIMMAAIIFGALFGLAFMALFKDNVSIIAIGAGSIIVGLAFNYPLHFLAHYQQGYSKEQTIQDIIDPLVTGNLTTVGSFLSLIFISSDAMKDLGLFSAMLLVGTILFVLIFLPHLFKKTLFSKLNRQNMRLTFGKVANFNLDKHGWVVLAMVLLTIPLYFCSKHTTFETNMQAINYMTPDQKVKMDKLMKETGGGHPTVYFVSEGKTLDEALQHYENEGNMLTDLQKKGLIDKQAGIGNFLPSTKAQQAAIDRWNDFWKTRKAPFMAKFNNIAAQEGFTSDAFVNFEQIINRKYQVQKSDYFLPIMTSFANNYLAQEKDKSMIYTILQTKKEQTDHLLNALNQRGEHVFAFDNSSMMSKMVNALSKDFNFVLWVCGLLVFGFLSYSFGRFELSILAFLPLTVGWIWILGLMDVFGMKFNIINIILATFIFGQGDDYTIFVTEGVMYEYTYRKKMLASYKNSVLLSASIMFIGIGSLIIAKHPAMKSLAEVTIVGMFSVVLMAYLIPPLIFRWLTTKKGQIRRIPITLRMLIRTFYCFMVFFIASIILTLVGFCLLTIGRKTQKHKLWYHKVLCTFLRWSAKMIPFVPYHIENQNNETFDKPSIIIANHQSHLDLLYLLLLNPKIICLTNHWVWKSPFYGWIIRYADYYPVDNGLENNEIAIENAIKNGYSVLIFPEGTRSVDNSIGRFHQGAFYMAKKFHVDILPIVTHGIGDIFPKTEFLLRKGTVNIRIMPRISPNDVEYFGNLEEFETAQLFRQYYKKAYEVLAHQCETPSYFHDLVYHNYIYKGREVEQIVNQLLRKHRDFEAEIAALPDSGEYYIAHCGYGVFALMAALMKKNLHIIATDEDADKIALAQNCVSVPSNLEYRCEKN